VHDTPENREVAGDAALYFRAEEPASLAAQLERLRAHPQEATERGLRAKLRAEALFSWETIAARYAALLARVAAG